MTEPLLIANLIVGVTTVLLLVVVMYRTRPGSQQDIGREVGAELRAGREETRQTARELREELSSSLKAGNDSVSKTLSEISNVQNARLDSLRKELRELTESNQTSLNRVRTTLDESVKQLSASNEKKLDEMRKTVDEKLQSTLEQRLGESFKMVSDRLEKVHLGLGEMKNLATGVGDLKRVLTNVKARGTWAEVQLGAILEQTLTPEQFTKNAQTKENSPERVEFAVKLPGPTNESGDSVLLPIDSKFPTEDYQRLQEAAEQGDADSVDKAAAAFIRTVRSSAKEIQSKYLNPPVTTDFAVMFLATEGMYAEVLRQPGLLEDFQQNYRIVIAGPTTLTAILTSLRMGFRTLAIEKQASEAWQVLAAVKTEFGKFGDVLTKVKRQLATASNTIDETGRRTRAMERKLRSVEQLQDGEAARVLELPGPGSVDEHPEPDGDVEEDEPRD